jgi:hypothetical protein
MKVLAAATLAIACAVGFAPTATAGDSDYLDRVQDRLTSFTPQQLLTEAYKVCAFMAPGRAAPDAIPMVIKDLNTSTSVASEIVTAAIVEMPC